MGSDVDVQATRLPVELALQEMASAVRKADIKQAAAIGSTASIPLSLQPQDLGLPQAAGLKPVASTVQLIATGVQGQVYRARWQGADVAVKVPRLSTTADLERFRREVVLMSKLGATHTHIMPVLGAGCVPPHYLLVMPLAAASLQHFMYVASPGWRPSWTQVIHIGIQLAQALATLHDAGIVHRDIKPDNILVQLPAVGQQHAQLTDAQSVQVLLADLGLACHETDLQVTSGATGSSSTAGRAARPTGGFHKHAAVGTQEYCAPELLMHSAAASPASDVFALMITLNELTTLTPPYSDCIRDGPPGLHTILDRGYTRQQLAAAVAGDGLRPPTPAGQALPPGWLHLLHQGWATDPSHRLTAHQLLAQLRRLADVLMVGGRGDMLTVRPAVPGAAEVGSDGQEPVGQEVDVCAQIMGATPCPANTRDACDECGGSAADMGMAAGQRPAQLSQDMHMTPSRQQDSMTRSEWVAGIQADGGVVYDCADPGQPPLSTAVPVGPHQRVALQGESCPPVCAGVFEAVGSRDTWEDRSSVATQVPLPALSSEASMSILAVFDGHRGAAAAEFCASQVQRVVQQALAQLLSPPGSEALSRQAVAWVVQHTLLTLEQEFFNRWDADRRVAAARMTCTTITTPAPAAVLPRLQFPGCTATLVLLVGNLLTVGNLGDGMALLGGRPPGAEARVQPVATCLTRPHTAALPEERHRLQLAGLPAVYHGQGGGWRLPGSGLQVTRSIGDYDVKGLRATPLPSDVRHVPGVDHTAVTAQPEICQLELQVHHDWLVLGSDGLWDVLNPSRVSQLIHDTVKHPAMSARRLVAEALDAGSTDNITAIVAFLRPVSTLEQVFTASS